MFFVFVDVSGVVFDTHSKMVMSQGGTFEKMKEKVRTYSISVYIRMLFFSLIFDMLNLGLNELVK